MLSRPFLLALRASRTLWVRVLIIAFLSVASLFLAPLLDPLIGQGLIERFSEDAVLPVLKILASGMLAVTTFSLNVMVTSFQSAASQSTPRAYRLLLQDTTTQNVLSTYVGSFLFSLMGIVLILAGFFTKSGIVVIYGMTFVVIILIIVTTVRWISHLSHLGSMDHTLSLVHGAVTDSLRTAANAPALGGVPMEDDEAPPQASVAVRIDTSGYVQFVDMERLNARMSMARGKAWIVATPGSFVLPGDALAMIQFDGAGDPPDVRDAFILGETRTPEQDARHGLLMLSEIGVRALSPGINDPGTAIDVIQRMMSALWIMGQSMQSPKREIMFPLIHAPRFSADALVEAAFTTIARDGGGRPDVVAHLMAAQERLARSEWDELAQAARRMRDHIMAQAREQVEVPEDRELVLDEDVADTASRLG